MIEKLGITPGPWRYGEKIAYGRDVCSTADDSRFGWVCSVNNVVYHDDMVLANTRLIAAAPEMLEALIELHDELENDNYNVEWIKDVIEKATGKTWEEIKRLQEE